MNLKLSLIIEALDKATAPIRRIAAVTKSLAGRSGLGHVTRAAGILGERFQGVVAQARLLKGVLLGIAGASVAGYTLQRFVGSVVDSGVEAVKAAKRTGMAVQQYQRLAYAAKSADVDQETFSEGLRNLQRNAVGAATGNAQAAIWFYRAGVNVRGMNGKLKPTNQLLEELAERFKKMPDGMKKSAIASGIFGDRMGDQLIPLLNEGAEGFKKSGREAEAFGLVMSDKDAKATEEFNNSMGRLSASFKGLLQSVVLPLLPALQGVVEQMTGWMRANRAVVSSQLQEFLQGLVKSLPEIWRALTQVARGILTVARIANGFAQILGGWGMVIKIVAGIIAIRFVSSIVKLIWAFRGLGIAMLTTPFGWFMLAVSGLVIAGYELYKHWDVVKEKFSGFWDTLKGLFSQGAAFITDVIRTLLNVTLLPFIEVLRLVNRFMPASMRNTGVGQTIQGSLDWLDNKPRATLRRNAAGLATQVGGTLNIKIDSDGKARVTSMKSDNDNVDMNVYTGGQLAASR